MYGIPETTQTSSRRPSDVNQISIPGMFARIAWAFAQAVVIEAKGTVRKSSDRGEKRARP